MEVNASAVRVENCREFGGPWLALELTKTLGLDGFLQETMPSGREDVSWSVMALVLVIARLCDPSSELSIAENFFRKTAMSDLLTGPVAPPRCSEHTAAEQFHAQCALATEPEIPHPEYVA